MPTRVEIDGAFLTKHNALTEKFYQAKREGRTTPALQALFDKFHTWLACSWDGELLTNGFLEDIWVDEEIDPETDTIIIPGTKRRSLQAEEILAVNTPSALEREALKAALGVSLG